jgi:hypothetical protein
MLDIRYFRLSVDVSDYFFYSPQSAFEFNWLIFKKYIVVFELAAWFKW